MSDQKDDNPEEALADLLRLAQSPAWKAIVARWERDFETLSEKVLAESTSDADTLALKKGRTEAKKLSPNALFDQLTAHYRSRVKELAGQIQRQNQ